MTIARFLAIALAAAYGLAALVVLLGAVLSLAALMEVGDRSGVVPAVLPGWGQFLLIGGLFAAAAIGLLREKRWVRWPSLAISLLALALVVQATPGAVDLYEHYRHPPRGAYVVLTDKAVFTLFGKHYAPAVGLLLLSVLATVFVFRRTK